MQSNEEIHLVQDKRKTKTKKPRSSNPNKTTKGSKKTWKCKFCGQAISAIKGHGEQMTSSITFQVDGEEKVPFLCQLGTGSTCNVISYTDLVQLLQDGNPPLNMTKAKPKLIRWYLHATSRCNHHHCRKKRETLRPPIPSSREP